MGVDIYTYGGTVSFTNDGADAVQTIKERLDASEYHRLDLYRYADYSAATRMDELFMEFGQFLISAGGQDFKILGYDDRFYDPQQLFEAAAPFLKDGSWIAYRKDTIDDITALVVCDGNVKVIKMKRDEETEDAPGLSITRQAASEMVRSYLINQGESVLPLVGSFPAWASTTNYDDFRHGSSALRMNVLSY